MPEIPSIFVSYMCREALLNYLQEHCPSTHAEKLCNLVHFGKYDGTVLFRQKLCSLLQDFSVLYIKDLSGVFYTQLLKEVENLCKLLGRKHIYLQKIIHNRLENSWNPKNQHFDMVIGVCDNLVLMDQIPTLFGPHGTAVLLTPSKVAQRPLTIQLRNLQRKEKNLKKIINFNGYVVLETVADFMITEYVSFSKGCSVLSLDKNLSSQADFDLFVGKGMRNVCFLSVASSDKSKEWFANIAQKLILDKLLQNKTKFKSHINLSALPIPKSYQLYQEDENNIKFISQRRLSRSGVLRVKPHGLFICSSSDRLMPLELLVAIFTSRLFLWYYDLYRIHEEDGMNRNIWSNAMKSFPCPKSSIVASRMRGIRKLVEALEWMDAMPFSIHSEFPLPSHIYRMQEVLDMVIYELYFASEMQQHDLLISLYLNEFVDKYANERVDLFVYKFMQWYDQSGNPIRDRINLLPIRSRELLNVIHTIK